MKKLPLSLLLCTILCFFLWPAQAQTITTLAGQGITHNGSGIPATAANLGSTYGIALDAANNLYVCDPEFRRVEKITPSGIITTFAGTGSWSLNGFAGMATATNLYQPMAIAVDHRGNVIIADESWIWKVDTTGYMTVIAGGGASGPADGVMATDASNIVCKGVAVDAYDNVYFTEGNIGNIYKIDSAGVLRTIAGDGSHAHSGDGGPATAAGLAEPESIVVSASGEIYCTEINTPAGTSFIRKIDASGIITTIAGCDTTTFSGDGRLALETAIYPHLGLYLDGSGNLFFTDAGTVRKISTSGIISTVAGGGSGGDGGPATNANLYSVNGVVGDASGDLYVSDGSHNRIRKVNGFGIINTIAGRRLPEGYSGDGGAATAAEMKWPTAVAIDRSGNKYIADAGNQCIRKVSAAGIITTIAGTGVGGFSGDGGPATAAQFYGPAGLAVDTMGNLYVMDKNNDRIRVINTSGIINTIAGGGSSTVDGIAATAAAIKVSGICLDAAGNIYYSDTAKVRKISTSGIISTVTGMSTTGFSGDGGPATAARVNYPGALAMDPFGNLFISDEGNRVIRKINASGTITRVMGAPIPAGYYPSGTRGWFSRCADCDFNVGLNMTIHGASAIAVDQYGNLYFAENFGIYGPAYGVETLRRLDTFGIVHTLAGIEENPGYTGDGGPAANAQLCGIYGLALDGSGNLFVAERNNDVVRKIALCSPAPSITSMSPGSVCVGGRTQIYCLATGTDNYWTSSDTAIFTVDREPLNGTDAVVAGVSAGTAILTLTNREICGLSTTDTTTVVVGAGIEGSIVGPRNICLGTTVTFTDSITGGTWGSYNGSVAPVTSGGVVTGSALGSTAIYYRVTLACGAALDTQMVNVVAGSVVSAGTITGTSSICSGTSTTLSDTASGGAWSSSATSIASVSTSGVVYGVSPGTATIRYMVAGTCNTDTASFSITITSSPSAGTISGPASVCDGSTIILTDPVTGGTWTSSNVAIASISAAGTVYGLAAGTATISYSITGSCGSATATYAVTVNPLPVAGTITGTTSACVGATTTLSSTPTGGSWYTANAAVASVSSTGVVTGTGSGSTTINYIVSNSCGADTAFTTVTITGLPAAGTITGASTVCIGAVTTLSDAVTGGTWSSTAAAVASINATTGVVTGISAGTTTISYTATNTCGSSSATHSLTVVGATSAGSVSGAGTICASATLSLSATVTGGTWVSGNPSVASVNTSGIVTGVSGGTVTIYYIVSGTCGADSALAIVTVNAAPVAGTITGGTGICMGATTTLTSSATGGTWSSSDASIASISTGGVVYSVSAGTVTLSYTVSGTCGTATATHSLNVYALPALSATTASGCGASTTLVAAGALYYSWSPATGLSCSTCSTVTATTTTTTNYTLVGVDGHGCVNNTTVSVNGNRIYGHVSFSGTAPDTLDTKVWLIQFTASDSSLTATDSTTTCLDGGVPYFEFMSQPTGNYMVKGKLIFGNVPGTSGYLPTYADSTINWYAAHIASHTSSTDNLNITMLYGTVPSGPGFIGGSVVSGAGKGTAGEVAERGMIIYLKNATGDVVTYVYTDAAGNYSFNGLAYGTYYVYPADFSYYTTPSGAITLSSSTPSVTGIKFKKYTTSGIIIPLETTGFTNINATGSNITIFPNPTNGELIINWNKAVSGGATFTVTDVAGRVVYTNKWTLTQSTSYHEQLPTLVTGMYQVTITSADFYYNGKLMVQQ